MRTGPPAPTTQPEELDPRATRRRDRTLQVYAEQPYGSFSYDRQKFNRVTGAILREHVRPGAVACDIGCGSGYWLEQMRVAAGSTTGGATGGTARLHGVDRAMSAVQGLRGRGFGL